MLGDAELVAFVTATDPERAARFYGEVLGLPLRSRSEFALRADRTRRRTAPL
jgi:catechol 2,3-dioxygenase-like lactoylglutathione lyase family enzyme